MLAVAGSWHLTKRRKASLEYRTRPFGVPTQTSPSSLFSRSSSPSSSVALTIRYKLQRTNVLLVRAWGTLGSVLQLSQVVHSACPFNSDDNTLQ